MARLLEAVRPDATILLVGDQGQLEAVESGSVLREIVASGSEPGPHGSWVFELVRVWRQEEGSDIGDLARAIREGRVDEAVAILGGARNGVAVHETAGHLGEAVRSVFGGFENLKTALSDAAMKRFGSGWAWLSADPSGKLLVEGTANQDSPIMHGNAPLFGIDVWEHAYYLKYQNKRADYVAAIYDVIDWDAVGKRFEALKSR